MQPHTRAMPPSVPHSSTLSLLASQGKDWLLEEDLTTEQLPCCLWVLDCTGSGSGWVLASISCGIAYKKPSQSAA
jgi:hypothetical protein